MTTVQQLAFQTWVIWGAAASFPLFLGRNPFPMFVAGLAALAVNRAWRTAESHAVGWGTVIRAAAIFSVIAIVFNILTVRAGDLVIVTVPAGFPLIAGHVTWNAVIYGGLAAFGVLGLVTVWATVGSNVQWSSLARLLPDPLVGFAVAGSAAINLVPQTAAALIDIREANAARGYRSSGVRGVATVLTPMINAGLDRSMRLAEVLEARGFGVRRSQSARHSGVDDLAWTALLGGAFVAGYGLIAGITWAAIGGIAATAAGFLALALRRGQNPIRRTRLRQTTWTRSDWIVIGGSAAVGFACLVAREMDSRTFAYEPYPAVRMPIANPWPLLALLGLFAPALIAPAERNAHD